MSALDEADFGSDTDDDDYVPEGAGEGHDASEEEHSGEEENTEDAAKTVKGKKKKKTKKVVNGRKNMFSDESEKVDWEKELEEERKELNEEKKKQKGDDLFAAFKKDTSSVTATKSTKNSSISSLFDVSTKKQTEESSKIETKNSSNRLASLFDDPPKKSQESNEKSVTDKSNTKPKSLLSGLFDEEPVSMSTATKDKSEISRNLNDEKKSDKIEIKKVFDFAGETVTVSKEVASDSSEAKKYLKSTEEDHKTTPVSSTGTKRPGGLAGIVGSIGKKQKMGVLDKSKLDWNSFVSQEGISEELKTHNRGKEGYVEKQMFLERADLRQFEIEKSIRDKNRKSLMK